MQTSKSKYIFILVVVSIMFLFSSCTETKVAEVKSEYQLVTPTQEELDEITSRLDPILSMFHEDYDCSKDNIYEYMFQYNHLDYVYPEYDAEVKAYIAEPLITSEYGGMLWYESGIPENDPLSKFPLIRDEIRDENGNVSEDLAYKLYEKENLYWQDIIIGHNKFSGVYMDWLVEGVWNGKANHDTFMEFEDGTKLYYHDGFYYTPECIGDRGGGIFFGSVIDSITPLDDGKRYEIVYTLYNDIDIKLSENNAVIGMKETADGFRFWSIYSIDYDIGEE